LTNFSKVTVQVGLLTLELRPVWTSDLMISICVQVMRVCRVKKNPDADTHLNEATMSEDDGARKPGFLSGDTAR
jgi:hypothetical protein